MCSSPAFAGLSKVLIDAAMKLVQLLLEQSMTTSEAVFAADRFYLELDAAIAAAAKQIPCVQRSCSWEAGTFVHFVNRSCGRAANLPYVKIRGAQVYHCIPLQSLHLSDSLSASLEHLKAYPSTLKHHISKHLRAPPYLHRVARRFRGQHCACRHFV